jgi:hypothetical protein
MTIFKASIAFPFDTTLPRDLVTINPHIFGTDPQYVADHLASNLSTLTPVGADPLTIKIYDAQKAPPSFPLVTKVVGTGSVTTTHPREVALCLSYYSTYNRPRFRGRLYIPGHYIGGTFGLRPTAGQITNALNFGAAMKSGWQSGYNWVVYSAKDGKSYGTTAYWVDDEWDIIRSRGLRGTTRQLGSVP